MLFPIAGLSWYMAASMGVLKPQISSPLTRLASGIEAGVIGGLAMLGMLVSGSLLQGHRWWEIPNLLGSTFYGFRALRSGTGLATLSGIALQFVITGTIGGLFGLVCGRVRERGRLILLGILAGIGVYNLANAIFWTRVNPLVPAYSPQPSTMLSYVLFGACLGWMDQRLEIVKEPTEPLVDRIE